MTEKASLENSKNTPDPTKDEASSNNEPNTRASINNTESKHSHTSKEETAIKPEPAIENTKNPTSTEELNNAYTPTTPLKQISQLEQHIKHLEGSILAEFKSLHDSLIHVQKLYEQTITQQKQLEKQVNKVTRHISENVWASIFNNTIIHSGWLKDKTFSPGRWAVGYPFLYAMYRILNEIRPQKILELGLGQSTRMIAQYASFFRGVEHYVVEHDQTWIDFFHKNFQISEATSLVQLNWGKKDLHDAKDIRIYEGLSEKFKDNKFDLIVIDGPLGGDMKEYSRIDTLLMLPQCLTENFIIMLDDYNRPQEQHTFTEMKQALDIAGLPYKVGIYSGEKDIAIIASQSLGFVCSM